MTDPANSLQAGVFC